MATSYLAQKFVPEGLTYDDVLLVPDYSEILPREVNISSYFTRDIKLNTPIVSAAAGSCGCTIPEWPKEPIKPGKEGKVNVIFSSEGKSGIQEKSITIITNCEPSTRIVKIKTDIVVPETIKEES